MKQSPFKYKFHDLKLDQGNKNLFSCEQPVAECVLKSMNSWVDKVNSPIDLTIKRHKFDCSAEISDNFNAAKPTLIISINNNLNLLEYTISNFKENKVLDLCNVVLVDDRSEEDIRSCVLENNLNYLRVDTPHGFNFSMLNNIGANVVDSLGGKKIIIWNSDLWVPDDKTLPEILQLHNNDKSKFSGTKLLYPPQEKTLNKDNFTYNIANHFPHVEEWRNKVQFGGDFWIYQDRIKKFGPSHYGRFFSDQDPRVNCNKGISFMTGAFQLFEMDFFKELGGFNPSLVKAFQDVDICLRSVECGVPINYYGKNLYMYHDESYSFYSSDQNKKHDKRHDMDHLIFYRMWGQKIPNLVLGK